MLDVLRQNASHWALKVALAVIALVFIFWGFGAQNAADPSQYAVKVNGEPVPFEDFQRAYQNYMDQRRNRVLPGEVQEQMAIGQVLDQLIEAKLLRQLAADLDMTVSKEELAARITEIFVDEKGEFMGKQKYLERLAELGREVGDFENDLREDILIQKARDFIQSSVKVTEADIREEWHARSEKVNVQFLRVDAASLAPSLEKEPVTDADITKFETGFPGLVEQLYAEEKGTRWTTPAKAKLHQITIRKPAAGKGDADAARRRAGRALETALVDWNRAAEQYSEGASWEKSGSARELTRREIPVAVADKVFTMEPGTPAEMVETPTSFVIVKVEAVTPEKVTELDEKVKREIIAGEIRAKRAEQAVESYSREAFAKLKAGESIEKVAAMRGLAVKESGAFTARSGFPGLPDAGAALVSAAFKLQKPGEVLTVAGEIPKAGDAYVLAVLKEHVVPDEKDFEQQKFWIGNGVRQTRGAEAFRSWKVGRLAESKIVKNPRLFPAS